MIKKLKLNESNQVIEIASNDGYLLQFFKDKNIPVLGIEPALNIAKVAQEKDIPTISKFFGVKTAKELISKGIAADLVLGNNVLAHVPDINNFVASLKKVLKKDGTITIEIPHLLSLIEKNEFDTIYHEHFFYFSILALVKIFSKHNLSIYDLDELETHGGSLRIYATHVGNYIDKNSDKKNVDRVLNKELTYGLDSLGYYKKLQHSALSIKLNSLQYLINNKLDGKKIIAFGAAAKGNTFLNYCGVKSDIIEAVIDETPNKIGKYLPQSKIPILSFSSIKDLKINIEF
jgi:SAM-dependent methyltransferase